MFVGITSVLFHQWLNPAFPLFLLILLGMTQVVDQSRMIIPDLFSGTILLFALAEIYLFENYSVQWMTALYFAGGFLLIQQTGRYTIGQEVLGGGDVKLVLALGLITPFETMSYTILLSIALQSTITLLNKGGYFHQQAYGPSIIASWIVFNA